MTEGANRSILRSRTACLAIAGIGVLQVALTAVGVGGWPCPFRATTGLPCPGCGLTRGVIALFQGDVMRSIQLHAFAPVAVLAVGVLVGLALLPRGAAERFENRLVQAQERWQLGLVLLLLLLGYWIIRLVLDLPQPGPVNAT
jgi:hypothetical protein